ncbi:MAG: hypothetical protein KDI62_14335 [Anaerolineae bacterium]|nr:hypothetical protein [Anaerolineae bacterium]MCB9109157.1 hypothetical protein [Anaerolineales bacterium]
MIIKRSYTLTRCYYLLPLVLAAILLQPSPAIFAQTGRPPFPGKKVKEGSWAELKPTTELTYLGPNRILSRDVISGQYRVWRFDSAFPGPNDIFPDQELTEGSLTDAGPGQALTYLGDSLILDWTRRTGQYQVQRFNLDTTRQSDLLSLQTTEAGTLPPTTTARRLIYVGYNRVLDWEPATGQYQIRQYAPDNAEPNAPFPGTLVVEGTWPHIRTGHELVYLGYRRILDWEPATGHYRIWRYDPMVTGSGDPLVGKPVAEGTFDTIGSGHQLMSLGSNHLLDWEPATGQYRVWEFDLISIAAFTIEDIGDKLADKTISGVTVVTHGRQLNNSDGDSLLALAQDIHNKAGGWLIDYDVDSNGNDFFDTCTNDCNAPASGQIGATEVVLLFDWAAESNEASTGWGEAAGDALFNLLIDINLLNPTTAGNPPYHFIAHSFGTAVTSELLERLARFHIPVDHVTFLDPHDFDQGLIFDGAQRLFDLGQPSGYGASVWNNVTFADAYYQTRGKAGTVEFVPDGRPIAGAYSRFLLTELPDPADYPVADVSGDHGYVWRCFYRATVTGSNPTTGCLLPVTAPNFAQTGYAFSRIASAAPRPLRNFYTGQSHTFSNPQIVDTTTGLPNLPGLDELGLTNQQIVQGRWTPKWFPAEITNGDFENYNTQQVNVIPLICNITENTCPQPGWTDHGGGGEGHFDRTNDNTYLILDWSNTFHTHNRLYVPPNATALLFDLRRQDGPSGAPDTLVVQLGDQPIASYTLAEGNEDADFVHHAIPLPGSFLGQVTTITFKFSTTVELFDGSTAWIDNVQFQAPVPAAETKTYLPIILN